MNWWSVGLLGGLVGLDATSFPQFMFSRPLIAGTLAGLLFGQPAEGMLIGALIEIFDLAILPVQRFPVPSAWSVLWRPGKQLSPAAQAFVEHLRQVARDWTPHT